VESLSKSRAPAEGDRLHKGRNGRVGQNRPKRNLRFSRQFKKKALPRETVKRPKIGLSTRRRKGGREKAIFLFGGERPPNKKALSLTSRLALLNSMHRLQRVSVVCSLGSSFLIQSPSPDWIRRKIFPLAIPCDSAVNGRFLKGQ